MEIRSLRTAPVYTTKDGSSVRAVFEFGELARNQSLVEASLPPGGATERHLHRTSEELYVVLEGGGAMEIEGDRRLVSVGDVVLIPPGARHRITAAGDGPLRFLCCCSPPYRHEDTELEERPPLTPAGSPEPPSEPSATTGQDFDRPDITEERKPNTGGIG